MRVCRKGIGSRVRVRVRVPPSNGGMLQVTQRTDSFPALMARADPSRKCKVMSGWPGVCRKSVLKSRLWARFS